MIQNDRAHDTGKRIGGSVQPIAQNEGDSSMKNANEHLLQPTYDRLGCTVPTWAIWVGRRVSICGSESGNASSDVL
jgi:hypothetical protein